MLRLQGSPTWIPVQVSCPIPRPRLFVTLPNVMRKPSLSCRFLGPSSSSSRKTLLQASSSSRKTTEGYDSLDPVHRPSSFRGSLSRLISFLEQVAQTGESCFLHLKRDGYGLKLLVVILMYLHGYLFYVGFTLIPVWGEFTAVFRTPITQPRLLGERVGILVRAFWSTPTFGNMLVSALALRGLLDALDRWLDSLDLY